MPEEGYERAGFDFDEEDIRRYRRQNLQDDPADYADHIDEYIYEKGRDSRRQSETSGRDDQPVRNRRIFRKEQIDSRPLPPARRRRKLDDTVIAGLATKKQTNKEIRRMAYVMLALLFGVILYFTWFTLIGSRSVINNPNNSLLGKLAEKIERGNIYSADGKILAQNTKDGNGKTIRYYPYENVFAHVVGTSQINKSGIEQAADYDLVTSDIRPFQKIINDIRGIKCPGNDVITTLDSDLQETASAQLGYQEGAIVAIEPSTGKILAMVSKPDYDPNTLSDYYQSLLTDNTSKVLLNQATQGVFVPGSIFKVVTTLAYLRSGYDPDSYSWDCDGSITLTTDEGDKGSISCYDGTSHGALDLDASFAKSCNAAYAGIGQMISVSKMNQVCDSLLFNKTLPGALPTARSVFSLKESDSAWTVGATAIGQGHTQISPMHAAMLTCAIANGGKLMEPYVVDKVVNADGKTIRTSQQKNYGELMTSKESARLRKMMEKVVLEGTGYALAGKNYTSAGKTGTAEVSGRGNNAWYIGYAPAQNPQIVVCVLVEDSGTGSSVAAPIAGALFDTWFGKTGY